MLFLFIKDLHKLRKERVVTTDNCLVKENELLGFSIATLLWFSAKNAYFSAIRINFTCIIAFILTKEVLLFFFLVIWRRKQQQDISRLQSSFCHALSLSFSALHTETENWYKWDMHIDWIIPFLISSFTANAMEN